MTSRRVLVAVRVVVLLVVHFPVIVLSVCSPVPIHVIKNVKQDAIHHAGLYVKVEAARAILAILHV
jgi:hypothetical protein